MNRFQLFLYILLFLCGTDTFAGAEKPQATRTIHISFRNTNGSVILNPGDTVLIASGEKITVEKFRYYVSNFSITDEKGKKHILPAAYFLVDEADPASKKITLTVPDVRISALQFLLGVDSMRNVSGVQTGALDPMKGMFWTWHSGYIMAKLEGTCEGLAAAGQRFTYHIGGFRFGVNTARYISLSVPEGTHNFREMVIAADVQKWFSGRWNIRIKETPVCHSPGPLAVKFADNYEHLFSLQELH